MDHRSKERPTGVQLLHAWPRIFVVVIVMLLVVDGLLLGANLVYHIVAERDDDSRVLRFFQWRGWYGAEDHSVIEVAGYIQLFVVSVMLIALGRRSVQQIYTAWGVTMFVMVADDALRLHEQTGEMITALAGSWTVNGMRSQDLYQILFWVVAAVVLGSWLITSHARAEATGRKASRWLFGSVLFLAFFAVGVDLIHAVSRPLLGRIGGGLFYFLETAGELVGVSLIMAVTFYVFAQQNRRAASRA